VRFQVIALRDLSRYVDEQIVPTNPWGIIEDRQRQLATNGPAQEIPEKARKELSQALGGSFLVFRDKVQEDLKLSKEQKEKLEEHLKERIPDAMKFFEKIASALSIVG
jgi:hypothetical protein